MHFRKSITHVPFINFIPVFLSLRDDTKESEIETRKRGMEFHVGRIIIALLYENTKKDFTFKIIRIALFLS